MKLVIFRISSIMLLAIQVNAQQWNPQPILTVENKITTNIISNVVATPEISVAIDKKQHINFQDQTPQKIKNFTKTFSVDKNDKINLANEYGSMTIKTWDKNEIKVDAEIKAYAGSDAAAQKLLDLTTINASKGSDVISFITDIDMDNNWSNGSKKREVKVFMTVYMPATNVLKATQEYGNLTLGDYSGPTSLAVEYGSLTTGDLKSSNNVIRIEYGKATIKSLNQGKITHEYGGGTTIGSAGSLNINAEYTDITIGSVRGKTSAHIEYVKLTANDISSSFAVTADYGSVTLGFDPAFRSSLNVATSYGSFKYGSNVNAKRQSTGDDDRYGSDRVYVGSIGKGEKSGENVSIKSEYTDIIFK
jgi:hypothetical protein